MFDEYPVIFRVRESYGHAKWVGTIAIFTRETPSGRYLNGPMPGASLNSTIRNLRGNPSTWEEIPEAVVETTWGM